MSAPLLVAPLLIAVTDAANRWAAASPVLTVCLVVLLAGAAVLGGLLPRPAGSGVPPLVALWLLWLLALSATSGASAAGVQNLLCYGIFAGGVYASYYLLDESSAPRLRTLMDAAAAVFAVVFALQVFVLGDGFQLIGIRSASLTALLALAWTAPAAAQRGTPRGYLIPLALIATIAATGSRTAFVVGVLVLAAGSLARSGRVVGLFLKATLGALVVVVVASTWAPLRDRFQGGDQGLTVGGFRVNTEGRVEVWRLLYDYGERAAWLGQGSGAASDYGRAISSEYAQPHNEYLRMLVDYGRIGLALFVLMLLALATRTFRQSLYDAAHRRLHVAAFLTVAALMATSVTDNGLVYYFIVAPASVVIGASLRCAAAVPLQRLEPRERLRLRPETVLLATLLAVVALGFFLVGPSLT